MHGLSRAKRLFRHCSLVLCATEMLVSYLCSRIIIIAQKSQLSYNYTQILPFYMLYVRFENVLIASYLHIRSHRYGGPNSHQTARGLQSGRARKVSHPGR